VIAKALQDNLEPGEVTFIEPSLVDSFWQDPESVRRHFLAYGGENIRHFRATTQECVESGEYRALRDIGLVFNDGYHSEEQARFDFNAFAGLVGPRGFVLFHDSMVVRPDKVYGAEEAYEMRVKYFIDDLKRDPRLQVMDWPYGVSGLTLVRKLDPGAPDPLRDWLDGQP
jgi:hypothetical protein